MGQQGGAAVPGPPLAVPRPDSLPDECSPLSAADFVVFPGSHVQLG